MLPAKKAILIAAFTLASCSNQVVPAATPTTNTQQLDFYATTSTVSLLSDFTTEYQQENAGILFEIGSSNYQALEERVLNDEIPYFVSNYLPSDSTLWAAPIGQDGIAVIVHPDNPLDELTVEEVREIYRGRNANWINFGGADMSIQVVSREDGAGIRAEFEKLVMGNLQTTSSARVTPSSTAMLQTIATTTGSIGYVSAGLVNGRVKPIAVNGALPTKENISNNSYPLRSPLFIIGKREPEGPHRMFIAWIQGQTGQAIVAERHAPLLQP